MALLNTVLLKFCKIHRAVICLARANAAGVCNQCALIKSNFHHFSIPLCADRSSTYLPISVCSTGSEEPQQGENVKLNRDMLLDAVD